MGIEGMLQGIINVASLVHDARRTLADLAEPLAVLHGHSDSATRMGERDGERGRGLVLLGLRDGNTAAFQGAGWWSASES